MAIVDVNSGLFAPVQKIGGVTGAHPAEELVYLTPTGTVQLPGGMNVVPLSPPAGSSIWIGAGQPQLTSGPQGTSYNIPAPPPPTSGQAYPAGQQGGYACQPGYVFSPQYQGCVPSTLQAQGASNVLLPVAAVAAALILSKLL